VIQSFFSHATQFMAPYLPGINLFGVFFFSFSLGAVFMKAKILGWDRLDKVAMAVCIINIAGNAVALLVP